MSFKLASFLLAVQVYAGSGLPAQTPAEIPQDQVRVRLVRMPVVVEERSAGACDGISAEQIEVVEDGLAVRATHLEPKRLRAVHAIVVDTSREMLDSLEAVRGSAASYVAGLQPDEPALLATFHDDLILQAPLSTDRSRFNASLQWIETGKGSHLWDSTQLLIRYLRSRPERKVLVLLTDGCDSGKAGTVSADEVIEMAAGTESLIVFPVGVEVPASCPVSRTSPLASLKRLAQRTGGEFYDLDSASQLDEILRAVRARVGRERYVTYEPVPFGRAPKDKPGKQSFRWRRRSVRIPDNKACRISVAGSPERYEAEESRALTNRDGSGSTLVRAFNLDSERERLVGEVRDIVRDSGPLALPGLDRYQRLLLKFEDSSRRTLRTREVLAPVPELERVVRDDTGPQFPVLFALALAARDTRGTSAPDSGGGAPWTRVPHLINGRTLLDVRESLARSLAADPDYYEWAYDKIRSRRISSLDDQIRELPAGEAKQLLRKVRKIFQGDQWTPEPRELEERLAGWLGDLSVSHVIVSVESWLAGWLLTVAEREGLEQVPSAAAEVERLWRQALDWFPPPTDVRVMGLLVPGYDPALEVVGYYRVLLRAPDSVQIATAFTASKPQELLTTLVDDDDESILGRLQSFNFSNRAPIGARFVRWMMNEGGAASSLVGRFDLQAVRYAHSSIRDLRAVLDNIGLSRSMGLTGAYPARLVSLRLIPRDDPSRPLTIGAYFAKSPDPPREYMDAPVCLVLPARQPRPGAERDLLFNLVAAQQQAAVPCILQSGG